MKRKRIHHPKNKKTFLITTATSILAASVLLSSACTSSGDNSPPLESGTAIIAEPVTTDASLPVYEGEPYAFVNHNVPFFTEDELSDFRGETYSELDDLGRCGFCMALITPDTMPTEERGLIGDVRPTGWNTVKYDGIDGNYLYNRCHLIGWQLTGQNSNPCNLITGTRYMNVSGMEPFESKVANYVREKNSPVLYRVTPVFEGSDLLASGVLIEAASVESDDLKICVYCFNVQPGITIDYATGASTGPKYTGNNEKEDQAKESSEPEQEEEEAVPEDVTYVGNSNSFKFHLPTCKSVNDMATHNKVFFYGTREDVLEAGYEPCKQCNP